MRSMKKLIAISLVVVMLFALAVPAFAWTWDSGTTNTTDFIQSADKEIVINAGKLPDNTTVTISGATSDVNWKYAYPYTLNKSYTPGGYTPGPGDADVYIMYDDAYIYIKEVRRHAPVTSGTADKSTYQLIVSEKTVTGTAQHFGAYIDSITPNAMTVGGGAVANNVVRFSKIYFSHNGTAATAYQSEVTNSGGESYSRMLNADCFEMETKIPWDLVGTKPTEGMLLGFKHHFTWGGASWGGSHVINAPSSGSHGNWDSYAPLYLRGVDAKASEQVIDTSWYNTTDTEFTLTKAGELRGLSYLVGSQASLDAAKAITAGKTFKLGADIDLNPNWTTASTTEPLYTWLPIGAFAGTFDGQGYAISNMVCVPGWNIRTTTGKSYVSWERDMGFIAHAYGNVTVKDLVIDDSEVSSKFSAAGLIAKVVDTAGTVNIENVYIDANVYMDLRLNAANGSGNWHNTNSFGGILIGNGCSTAENWATVNNVVLTGSLDLILSTSGSAAGTGPVWGNKASNTASISNVFVSLSSNTATAYKVVSGALSTTETENNAYRTRYVANGDNGSTAPWTESNTVYVGTDGTLKTGASQNGSTNNTLSAYPEAWVNIDNSNTIEMPPEVAAMYSRNFKIQESVGAVKLADGETDGLGIVGLTITKTLDWDKIGWKVEAWNGTEFVAVPESDELSLTTTTVYDSVAYDDDGTAKTAPASELGGKYIAGFAVAVPNDGKIRVTPLYYAGETAYEAASCVITFANGSVVK